MTLVCNKLYVHTFVCHHFIWNFDSKYLKCPLFNNLNWYFLTFSPSYCAFIINLCTTFYSCSVNCFVLWTFTLKTQHIELRTIKYSLKAHVYIVIGLCLLKGKSYKVCSLRYRKLRDTLYISALYRNHILTGFF